MKTALISGGSEGIGKGAVIQLLNDGFNVSTFSRDKSKCTALFNELKKKYPNDKFLVLEADVTDENSMKKVVDQTIKKFKNIDVLFNNAGIGYFADCDKLDLEKFQKMIQVNIIGVALLTKMVVLQMKKQRSGLILNIASISGRVAFANGEFYSATKFAVMGYSEGIRNELKDFGIKVATLCPGMIRTNFFDAKELERRMKIWKGKMPAMLEVEDINKIISLICNQPKHCDIRDIIVMPFG